jgi:hypothetical protein
VAAVNAVSRAFGVFSAGLIVLSIIVVCHMVFVRAVLGQSSIWQTEFVTFSLIAATFLGAPYILLVHGHVCVDVVPLMLKTSARRRLHFIGSLFGAGLRRDLPLRVDSLVVGGLEHGPDHAVDVEGAHVDPDAVGAPGPGPAVPAISGRDLAGADAAGNALQPFGGGQAVTPLMIGLLIVVATLLVLATGCRSPSASAPWRWVHAGVRRLAQRAFRAGNGVRRPERFHPGVAADVHHHGRGGRFLARRLRPLRGAGALAAPRARLAGDFQHRRLRAVLGAHRLLAGHLRGDRQDGHPRDAQARLRRRPRHRRDRRRRHAGHPDPAQHHHDPLRHRLGNLDRPPVHRRHHPGPAAHRAVHGLGAVPQLEARHPAWSTTTAFTR